MLRKKKEEREKKRGEGRKREWGLGVLLSRTTMEASTGPLFAGDGLKLVDDREKAELQLYLVYQE